MAPRLVGILNLTPDSFSDGGRHDSVEAAVAHGLAQARAGAWMIDVGGESTRPGSRRVPAEEQIRRVVPAISALAEALPAAGFPQVPLSIDTTLAPVAAAACAAGASFINDVSAGEDDPELLPLAASLFRAGRLAGVSLMHKQGDPADMQAAPRYPRGVLAEVRDYLRARAAAATALGLDPGAVWLDPGFGFGKTLQHNLSLMQGLRHLASGPHPLWIGVSRKRMVAELDGREEVPPQARLPGSLALALHAHLAGAAALRVHDVAETRQFFAAWDAARTDNTGS